MKMIQQVVRGCVVLVNKIIEILQLLDIKLYIYI